MSIDQLPEKEYEILRAKMSIDQLPEKEYEINDNRYRCLSGGGYQKLKLYNDDIAFEQTCPSPWPILCFLPIDFGSVSCPIYWLLMGRKYVVRKPYTKIDSVILDKYEGPCCDCCCPSSFFIKGFFGDCYTPTKPVAMQDVAKMQEMCSLISKKIAESDQKMLRA